MFRKSSRNSQKNLRSSHPEVFCQRMFWDNFQNSQKNIFQNIFFNKVAGWKPEALRSRHFSHVTKSRIFKNLNFRKKAYRNFRGTFLKNRFRHLKLYSNPLSWLARSRCHMGTFWETKDWSSHFWESQPFRFWYVEVQCQRRLKWTKTGISS